MVVGLTRAWAAVWAAVVLFAVAVGIAVVVAVGLGVRPLLFVVAGEEAVGVFQQASGVPSVVGLEVAAASEALVVELVVEREPEASVAVELAAVVVEVAAFAPGSGAVVAVDFVGPEPG
jgi:hypothetical protein